ncbi:MAG: Mur ligase family protein [Candidatus Aminicenantes bacterium]|jgi:UDP-N-acetylmuramate: L-alanyl-gamma-D-glutamyl-meso-diaminopimelate ligase
MTDDGRQTSGGEKVFLSGIAGTGMSSLAGLFKQNGYQVLGSDVNFYPPVDKILEKMNAKIFHPYDEKNIPKDVDFCIIGNIISRGNPEAEYILNNDIQYYSMAEALYQFFIKGKKSIVAAGTHGKTTIASFVSYLLHFAGMEPGFFIGGKPLDFDSNHRVGTGDYFVIEGDEYETSFFDRSSKFLKYHPYYLIISALEYDHADFFPSESLYLEAFQNLVNQVPSNGLIILNNDYPLDLKAVEKAFTPVVTYGTANNPDYPVKNIVYKNSHYTFTLKHQSKEITFTTPLSGRYNAWNLTAGIILGLHLGIPVKTLREAMETFKGVERRLNQINHIDKTLFLEDFAHHPTSIKQVLQSVREAYPYKRLIALFEPRSWSLRRNFFQHRLAASFLDADEIFIKEVYQKEKIPPADRLDVSKIKDQLEQKGKKVTVFDDTQEIKDFLKNLDYSRENVVVILSNGSFDGLPGFVRKLSG